MTFSAPVSPRQRFFVFILATALALGGCARGIPRPPVSPGSMAPRAEAATGFYHVTERGQTLYRIAKMYGTDVRELMHMNHISNPSRLEVGQRLFIPRPQQAPFLPSRVVEPVTPEDIKRLIDTPGRSYPWRTLTLHHSGTLRGSAIHFHRDHLRRGMGGLFYHFVIGNGSYTPDGAIEVGWRWKKQIKANRPYDIQICVVGDFNRQEMTEAQFSSVCHLVAVLEEQFGISLDSVRRHEDIKGKHTECPGQNFPYRRILQRLSERR